MRQKRIRKTTPELDQGAKKLRRKPTPAEAVLWERVRGKRVLGYRFRRQHPVGRAILDFYCPEGRLCIELDGPVHDQTREHDAARNAWLATHGVRVLRFRNEDVFTNLDRVIARIAEALPPPGDP
jgi:very-short-patch-repair endonuclease